MSAKTGVPALPQSARPSRRLTPRALTSGDVWVCWQSQGQEDVSKVRDIGLGGLFVETPEPRAAGLLARLHFLVAEGQIRADAEVRHGKPGVGMGLKFKTLNEQDGARFAALLARLRRAAPLTAI